MPTLEERVSYLEGKGDEHSMRVSDLLHGVREQRDEMIRRFDTIDARFAALDGRFAALDGRFAALDGRFAALDGRFGVVDGRFGVVDARLAALDGKLDRHFTWLVGIQVATLVSIVGALIGAYYR